MLQFFLTFFEVGVLGVVMFKRLLRIRKESSRSVLGFATVLWLLLQLLIVIQLLLLFLNLKEDHCCLQTLPHGGGDQWGQIKTSRNCQFLRRCDNCCWGMLKIAKKIVYICPLRSNKSGSIGLLKMDEPLRL